MSLVQRITDLTTRVATEIKAVRSQFSGNNSGALTALNTTDKSSLLAAINEVNTAQAARVSSSLLGVAGGVATLNGSGQVPAVQLPSFVDDVLEFASLAAFPGTGETGKIYVALDTNIPYRWSGSVYVNLNAGAGVTSVFTRSGNVTAQAGDYSASLVTNNSGVTGASVANALDTVAAAAAAAQSTANNSVWFIAQSLTAPQQGQARTNIGAQAAAEIGNPETDFVATFNAGL